MYVCGADRYANYASSPRSDMCTQVTSLSEVNIMLYIALLPFSRLHGTSWVGCPDQVIGSLDYYHRGSHITFGAKLALPNDTATTAALATDYKLPV